MSYTSTFTRSRYDELNRLPSALYFALENSLGEFDDSNEGDTGFEDFLEHAWEANAAEGENAKAAKRHYQLPLLSVSTNVDVHGTVARTVLKQSFHNPSIKSIDEANYSFPLYDGAAVVKFQCEIGSTRVLEGQVKPKPEALEIYRKEVAERKAAALLQEHTPEVFETQIGNLPARTTVVVEIVYLQELKAALGGEGCILTIPTSIAPRYGSLPSYGASSAMKHEGTGLTITIDIHTKTRISKVQSTTHPIALESEIPQPPVAVQTFGGLESGKANAPSDNHHARVNLSDSDAVLGKDFVLHIVATENSLLRSQAVLEPCLGGDEHAAMMVSIAPMDLICSDTDLDKFEGEIVFLADRSGSMENKIATLRKAMNLFLKSLPPNCSFNVFSFGSTCSSLWPSSKIRNDEYLETAIQHIAHDFRADLGGTEILSAMQQVVKSRAKESAESTQVIVVTDGEVWNADEVYKFVADTRSELQDKIRFFALGLGDRVSHRLIESIAKPGGGFGQVLGDSRLNAPFIDMLTKALMPSNWTCEIIFGTQDDAEKVEEPNIQQHSAVSSSEIVEGPDGEDISDLLPSSIQGPFQNRSLHPFLLHTVYFLLKPGTVAVPQSVTVKARDSAGHEAVLTIPVATKTTGPSMIRELAAKAIMLDLQNEQSWLHTPSSDVLQMQKPQIEEKARAVAEALGTKYMIVGKWTTFVAVDRTSQQSKASRLYKAKQGEAKGFLRARPARKGRSMGGSHSVSGLSGDSSDPMDSGNTTSRSYSTLIADTERMQGLMALRRTLGSDRPADNVRQKQDMERRQRIIDAPLPKARSPKPQMARSARDATYCNNVSRPASNVSATTDGIYANTTLGRIATYSMAGASMVGASGACASGVGPSRSYHPNSSQKAGEVAHRTSDSQSRSGEKSVSFLKRLGSAFSSSSADSRKSAEKSNPEDTRRSRHGNAYGNDTWLGNSGRVSQSAKTCAPLTGSSISEDTRESLPSQYGNAYANIYDSQLSASVLRSAQAYAPEVDGITGSQAPQSQPAASAPFPSRTVTLDDLVLAQQARGAFVLSTDTREQLMSAFPSPPYERIKALIVDTPTTNEATDAQLVTDTALVVLYLMTMCRDQESEWKYIVRNALQWLKQYGIDREKLDKLCRLELVKQSRAESVRQSRVVGERPSRMK